MINVAVIGVGYLGQHHARIYSELDNVKLIGVVDVDTKRAKEIARKYGCDWYDDYREMLDRVDALSIVTPTTMHYKIAMDCIKAGKDILIEKPITTTVEEANRLIDAAEKAGITIQVGHLERFNPVFSEVCRLIDNPLFIEAERMSPFLGRGIDVDITLDLMIHDIDIILAIVNKSSTIKDIKATGANVLTDNIDIAMAWIEFDSGVQALMKSSRISSEKSRKLKIFQKDAYLLVDYQNMEIKRFYRKEPGAPFQQNLSRVSRGVQDNGQGEGDKNNEIMHEIINVEKKEPLKEELKSFIKCVESKSCPLVSAVDGRNALEIALQISSVIRL